MIVNRFCSFQGVTEMTAVCVFATKLPERQLRLPGIIRALFQAAERDSALNAWGAGRYYKCDPDRAKRDIYHGLDSAQDPENLTHKSGAAQFAEFFEMAATEEEEERLVQSFMINL